MNFNEVLGEELAGQVQAKIDALNATQTDPSKHVKFVDLSEGGYVGKNKFDDRVNSLSSQVDTLQKQIGQRDTDMADLQAKLAAATADGTKLIEAQESLKTLQTQYAKDKTDWETRMNAQAYEFKVRELTNGLSFTSKAAKNEFLRSAIAKNFQMEGEKVLGFDDYVKAYQESDPTAFVAKADPAGAGGNENTPKLDIVLGAQGNNPKPNEAGFGFHFQGVRPHEQ